MLPVIGPSIVNWNFLLISNAHNENSVAHKCSSAGSLLSLGINQHIDTWVFAVCPERGKDREKVCGAGKTVCRRGWGEGEVVKSCWRKTAVRDRSNKSKVARSGHLSVLTSSRGYLRYQGLCSSFSCQENSCLSKTHYQWYKWNDPQSTWFQTFLSMS